MKWWYLLELQLGEVLEVAKLYKDGDHYNFMDTESFDQIALIEAAVGDAARFLKEQDVVDLLEQMTCGHGLTGGAVQLGELQPHPHGDERQHERAGQLHLSHRSRISADHRHQLHHRP